MDKKAQAVPTNVTALNRNRQRRTPIWAALLLVSAGLACNFALPTPEIPTPAPTESNPIPPTLAPIRVDGNQTRIIATQPVISIISTATPTPTRPTPTETPFVDTNLRATSAPLPATATLEPGTEPTQEPTQSPEENRLSLSYEVAWYVNQDDLDDVIAKIEIIVKGGEAPFRFFWDDVEILDREFALDTLGCEALNGRLSVTSADGQRAETLFEEFTPCG